MSKCNSKENALTFNGEVFEFVSTYKYLGMLISKNGKIHKMVEDRVKKNQESYICIKASTGYIG